MPLNQLTLVITFNGTGTEIPSLDTTSLYGLYYFQGTAIAIGNYGIVPTGTPSVGTSYKFVYRATLDITTNSKTFTLFGTNITQAQLVKNWDAEATWNGSSWDVELHMDFADSDIISSSNLGTIDVSANIPNGSIDLGLKGINLSLTNAKIATNSIDGSAKLIAGSVTDTELATGINGAKLSANTVANASLATMADHTVKANISGGTTTPSDVPLSSLTALTSWSLTGNSGTTPGTNFVGTTDASDLVFKTNNTVAGRINLSNFNTSFGLNSFDSVPSATLNTGIGASALTALSTGMDNTCIGFQSLFNTNTGYKNTAIGVSAGIYNTSGSDNTYVGHGANPSSSGGGTAIHRIALGSGAEATADYQFALPNDVTAFKFRGNSFTLPSADGAAGATLQTDGSKNLSFGTIISSGVYLPVSSNITNVSASTTYTCQWMRVGAVVTVSGQIDIDPVANADTVLGITIPVSSAFTLDYQCGGTAVMPAVSRECAAIVADPGNNRVLLKYSATNTAVNSFYFSFTYQVI